MNKVRIYLSYLIISMAVYIPAIQNALADPPEFWDTNWCPEGSTLHHTQLLRVSGSWLNNEREALDSAQIRLQRIEGLEASYFSYDQRETAQQLKTDVEQFSTNLEGLRSKVHQFDASLEGRKNAATLRFYETFKETVDSFATLPGILSKNVATATAELGVDMDAQYKLTERFTRDGEIQYRFSFSKKADSSSDDGPQQTFSLFVSTYIAEKMPRLLDVGFNSKICDLETVPDAISTLFGKLLDPKLHDVSAPQEEEEEGEAEPADTRHVEQGKKEESANTGSSEEEQAAQRKAALRKKFDSQKV
ncbi:MAG: hypothetical protein HON43_02175 [Alphaproteobacteria bacterium]|jgi:hypothetical protein|nr:hypothetical protein [Alphaproteobacteria bacterium]MBT5389653.1 hypothetical protein [Alphaproteobacteria bacterium]